MNLTRQRQLDTDFDQDATRAAILYTASRVATPSFHKISKIFYFADRLHLERYGCFMFGDEYWAMRFGPVPMQTYRFMDAVRNSPELACTAGFRVVYVDVQGVRAPVIRPLKAPDMEELSKSVLTCLEDSIQQHGSQGFRELTELSHDAAWCAVSQDEVMDIALIARTLPNAAQLLEHLSDPYP